MAVNKNLNNNCTLNTVATLKCTCGYRKTDKHFVLNIDSMQGFDNFQARNSEWTHNFMRAYSLQRSPQYIFLISSVKAK